MISTVKQWGVPIPREHGAWAMFLAPVLVGIGAARIVNIPVLLFLVTAFGFFLLRYPLMLVIKSRAPQARATAVKWSAIYGGVTGAAGLVLVALFGSWHLTIVAALGILSLAVYLWHASRRAEMSTAGEWVGIAGLMLGAPGAYLVATGEINSTALSLYLLSLLYFGGTVFYVKFRVREQPRLAKPSDNLIRKLWIGRTTLLYHMTVTSAIILMAAIGLIPALAILAFVPMLCKTIGGVVTVPRERLNIRRLGFIELGLTVIFATCILVAFG